MPNQNLISVFEKLIQGKQTEITNLKKDKDKNKKEISQNTFKIINFRKALGIIKDYPNKINKGDDIKHIKGIGKGIITRIDEIIKEGTLEGEIKEGMSIEFSQNEELQKITGVGPSKSMELFQKNITLDKILKEMKKIKGDFSKIEENNILSNLTHHQLIGVKYFKDINLKIPREEIRSIQIKLNRYIKQLNKNYEVHICGSYRRKKLESGDIDVLILHPDIVEQKQIDLNEGNILGDIISYLTDKKILVDHLTEDGKTKYMGICKTTTTQAMRIDIRLIPKQSYPFALLYFTGSKKTNTYMRNIAIKSGYKLSEYGLFDKNNNSISLDSEESIFKFLKIPYIIPEKKKKKYLN
jgi:DNA polymerase/3'-5' exonuclease PolX